MAVGIKFSLIPKKNRRLIFEYLFKEGVIVVQKNPKIEKHPEIPVPNLHVMMVMRTLKSKDFCEEMFNWQHNYYTLKNEGVEYLREYLCLPSTVFPATLTKKTSARPQRAGADVDGGAEPENWRAKGFGRGRGRVGERGGAGDRSDRPPRYAVGMPGEVDRALRGACLSALSPQEKLALWARSQSAEDRESCFCQTQRARMLKKLTKEDVAGQTLMKSSAQRAVKAQILQDYPRLQTVIEEIWPKRAAPFLVKCHDKLAVIVIDGKPIFFQHRSECWLPTLRLLHQYPSMMPKMQVDRGAIKFVLRGSNVMCPGLTSPGGRMEEVQKDRPVQIVGEGKNLSCAVGIALMSTQEILKQNKGPCIETHTFLGDGLWNFDTLL